MEHPEQDEFCRNQMQEIAIQAVETTDAERQLYFQEAGEESRRNEDGSGSLINYFESRFAESESGVFDPRSNLKGIDCQIKNRFCRMMHRDGSIRINNK